MKKFSIIIPTYNQPQLLKRAIDSVLKQDMTDYEIIIADDSSNDDVRQYAESLHLPCVSYYRHEATGQAADNWDFGLLQATGDYLILMHHDEAMKRSDYLSNISRQMAKGVDICVSDIEVSCNGQRKASHLTTRIKRQIIAHPAWLFLINAIGPSACIAFRREQTVIFQKGLLWLVDVEWYYRLLKGKKVVYVPTCCIQSIHGHVKQLSKALDVVQAFDNDKQIIFQAYKDNKPVKLMTWLYGLIVIGTKKILGKI